MKSSAPVGCAMLLMALVAGILLGLLRPDSIDSRAPSTPAPDAIEEAGR